ncbi:DUF262 domain-containing protein [Micromonospora sp. NPDC004551]|uniref:DUF262 domain-containing protein n=1 Tax=Micromonospora sp. NPDC004551 TaxID=3154284 RepID=UPI0033BD1C71
MDNILPGMDPEADEYSLEGDDLETAGTETEDDIADAPDINFRNVVLAPSDWTVQTILSQLGENSFELDPDFQRRNAWTDSRKSKFIESLMLGLPIPQLIFAEREDESGDPNYVVIDGKQRLLALDAFYSDTQPLRLTNLTVLPALSGRTRAEILEDPSFSRYVKRLTNRTIRTVVIRSWPEESFLHLVFHRINHQTLALSAQELRQALHPGPFTRFADKYAGDSADLHRILGTSQQPDFRMRDVELLVRHLAYRFRIVQYKGNLKRFLDETCVELNRSWSAQEEDIRNAALQCDEAIRATEEIFGSRAFRRRTGKSWETRFNRAVFDVMTYYFADRNVRNAAVAVKDSVVEAFERVSIQDSRFSESLASTTKTLPATAYRLGRWGVELGAAIGQVLEGPTLSPEGRSIRIESLH